MSLFSRQFINSIQARGLLSFGLDSDLLELGRLNVLIGPNASGKSNLIDAIRLLRSLPLDLQGAILRSGGGEAWFWKGLTSENALATLRVDSTLSEDLVGQSTTLTHTMGFVGWRFDPKVVHPWFETILDTTRREILYETNDAGAKDKATIRLKSGEFEEFDIESREVSVLSQIRSYRDYPEITALAILYLDIATYSGWEFGRESMLRRSQPADQRGDRLAEDYSNLALVLNQMGTKPESKQHIIDGLRELYGGFTNYEVVVNSGSVQIFFTEGKSWSIPATRLSDGTLRYLCLLAILYNPNPPPVVCIEEPELGLHPDIVAGLAKHLVAASERMQIIVTTHSDILVDALTEVPESIIVCENVDGATQMKRLDPDKMGIWLEKYRLGELWTSGELGGNRW